MSKSDYLKARALLRANGRYALKWLEHPTHCMVMEQCYAIAGSIDYLAQRSAWVESGMPASLAIRLR